jgi:hypothetical protein
MGSPPSGSSQEVTERLQALGNELRGIHDQIQSGEVDPVVLRDFREAVDNIRKTAWVVQGWLKKQQQKDNPYPLLPLLTEERIRRTAQLCQNLTGDLEAVEVTYESEGLPELNHAVGSLHKLLAQLFKDS